MAPKETPKSPQKEHRDLRLRKQYFPEAEQLVFSTSVNGKGWDGTISGQPQHSGVYVWMVKAVDYTGAPYLQRGTVTLIR